MACTGGRQVGPVTGEARQEAGRAAHEAGRVAKEDERGLHPALRPAAPLLHPDAEPLRIKGDHVRDESEQVTYLRELLEIFEQEGVDSAFWFTFAGYGLPHRPEDPEHDKGGQDRQPQV